MGELSSKIAPEHLRTSTSSAPPVPGQNLEVRMISRLAIRLQPWTNHAQGSWQLVDEDSVVTMLGGFYLVTFDLRTRRGHGLGFDRNGGRFERHLVWARK